MNRKINRNKLILGILIVLIGLFLGFLPNYLNFTKQQDIKDIEAYTYETINEDVSGLVKLKGNPGLINFLFTPLTEENVLYYNHVKEEFVLTPDYTDISEITCEEKWQPVVQEEKITTFKIGTVKVDPVLADKDFNLLGRLYEENVRKADKGEFDDNPCYNLTIEKFIDSNISGQSENIPEELKVREKIEIVSAEKDVIVIGELIDGEIKSGSPFILSNKPNEQLTGTIEVEDLRYNQWIRAISALVFAFGLIVIFKAFK